MRALVECRIKPYYLHHGDLAPGTSHLRTSIEQGQELMRALRGRLSGLCQPTYVLDIPGGHGKSPIGPNYLSRDEARPHARRGFQRGIALLSADDVIRLLDLKPHPEGGHFRETFRDPHTIEGGRAASTAIYFLLKRGERSHWHRVDAAEAWHWYAGGALMLRIRAPAAKHRRSGSAPTSPAGERPQAVVPAQAWQAAESLGDWTLVGCTVAPGFEFTGLRAGAANGMRAPP